jgi:hypothetical protein
MSENGKAIQDYLENAQQEVSWGCEDRHKFSRNGAIFCIRCGKIKPSLVLHCQNTMIKAME